MFRRKDWEVCLYADYPKYQVTCKNFRTMRGARHFVKKILNKNDRFYCATIWRENRSQFQTYYWNGERIIKWEKAWVLSSRQAMNLEVDRNGNIVNQV